MTIVKEDVEMVRSFCHKGPVRIAVLGSIVKDKIFTHRGEVFESFGGILYNIQGFFMTGRCDFTLVPLFYVGYEDVDTIKGMFRGRECIDWSFLKICDRTDENVIVYESSEERKEDYRKFSPPLSQEDAERLMGEVDAILLNFISEMDFKDGMEVFKSFDGVSYVDLHKRTFHLSEKDVLDIAGSFDIVQCNKREFEFLKSRVSLDVLFSERLKHLVVTLGEKGAMVSGPELSFRFFPSPPVEALDPTGAGDVFGSVFLITYLGLRDPFFSLCEAVKVASYSVTKKGVGFQS